MLRNMKVSGVFGCVVIAVANEGSLEMVMKISVRDSNPFRRMGYVDQPIIVVFVMVKIGEEFAVLDQNYAYCMTIGYKPMIYPNVCCILDTETVPISGKDILADNVAYNNVSLFPNEQTDANKL